MSDEHEEGDLQLRRHRGISPTQDPKKQASEETWSFAVENTFHATQHLDFVAGVSYDMNEVLRVHPPCSPRTQLRTRARRLELAERPRSTATARPARCTPTSRAARAFRPCSTATARALERKRRTQHQSERATNYEIGVSDTLVECFKLSSAVFLLGHRQQHSKRLLGPTETTPSSGSTPMATTGALSFPPTGT